ncbi:MATE family efflux transporter, partial [Thalassospira xiamenensis]
LFGAQIIKLLTDIPEVIAVAQTYLPWLVVMPLLAHWSYFYDGVFIGLSLSRAMRNTMLAAAVLVFLPLWWFGQNYANHGLWLALAGFLLARGVAQAIWLQLKKPF